MKNAFLKATKALMGIKVKPPKPTVNGKEFSKYASEGMKLGLEKPFAKLPGVAASIVVQSLGSHMANELLSRTETTYKRRKATATFLVTSEDRTLGEVVGKTTYENYKIESTEDFERAAIEHFVWCQARFKADCYDITIECNYE